jgi:trehalose 6-phosphate phosphatase
MRVVSSEILDNTARDVFSRLDPASIALLLDVDGTLCEIAPSPSSVIFSPDLIPSLRRLFELTDGALALVSGRPIGDLDQLLAPLRLPAIGGHGAELRLHPDQAWSTPRALSVPFRQCLKQAADFDEGIVIEDKGYSVALHYRMAPDCARRLRELIATCRGTFGDEPTDVLPGKGVFEVKQPGISKGAAVEKLMTLPPFAGRMPVFVGDDITDETVFEMMTRLGGKAFSVVRHFPGLAGVFRSPKQVRSALRNLAGLAPPS